MSTHVAGNGQERFWSTTSGGAAIGGPSNLAATAAMLVHYLRKGYPTFVRDRNWAQVEVILDAEHGVTVKTLGIAPAWADRLAETLRNILSYERPTV